MVSQIITADLLAEREGRTRGVKAVSSSDYSEGKKHKNEKAAQYARNQESDGDDEQHEIVLHVRML